MASLLHTVIANFETSLASRLANGATTGTLSSITDKDGNTIPNGTYTMIFEPGTSNEEHLRFTLTSTAMSSIYSINRQGTATSGVQAASGHRAGSKVILTDWVNLKTIKDILDGDAALDGSDPLYYDTDPTFTSDQHIITKKYADDLAIAGSPDASTTVKGIVEEATEAEINAGTAAGGTSARLFINPSTLATSNYGTFLPSTGQKDALVGTSGTPGSSNKYVTADDVAENTASKVVRRKSDSNVTVPTTPTASTDASSKSYVDTSIVRPFYQAIGMNGFGAALRAFAGATSDTDGTLYVASVTSTTSLTISRFALDSGTKMYYRSHTTTLSVTGSLGATTVVGMAVLGTYLYLHVSDSSPAGYLRRYDKADLANVTSMTYSGTAPDTATNEHTMYSNGTDIIVKSATTTWYRYTISGTTATNAATVTTADATAAVGDGSKVYMVTSGDTIERRAFTGGAAEASTDFNIAARSDNDVYRGLALFDTTRIYFIQGVQAYDETSTVANVLHLYPFTKP